MFKDKKNLFVQLLAIIGLLLSVKLAMIYYDANYNKYALSSFCTINEFIDCDGVAKTPYAIFLGIPLAYWGIFLYLTILFLTFVDTLKKIKFLNILEVFKEPEAYITFLGTISFCISMILAGISLNVIHKLCILCLATYFIDLFIALVACKGNLKNLAEAFKTTFSDFVAGAKKYTAIFIALVLLCGSFLAYSETTLNFVPNYKKIKSIMKYRKIKYNPFRVSGNVLGNPDGNVVVEVYSDYVCPHCYINNIMMHQAAAEFKNVYIIHRNMPFDSECNRYMASSMHPKACFMSRGAIAAGKQGNYWGMSSLLYENHPQNMDEMLKYAEQLGFDTDKFIKDFYSDDTKARLNRDIERAAKLDVHATPTMLINGEKIVGTKPYYEIKEKLIQHGARKK